MFYAVNQNIVSAFFTGITIFFCHTCDCGPFLDSDKIKNIAAQVGPGSVPEVLRDCLKQFILCAKNSSEILQILSAETKKSTIGEILQVSEDLWWIVMD